MPSIGAKALIVPTSVWVIGTYDREGIPDARTAAWGGICCSKSPCVATAVQKIRYMYNNLLECKLIHTLELGLHTFFVGEVPDIKTDKDILGEKGLPDMNKFKRFTYNPEMRTYFAVGEFLGKAFSIGKEIRSG